MVGGNAALWLRLDNLSERGGGGPRDRLELARRVAGCDILGGMGRSSSSMSGRRSIFDLCNGIGTKRTCGNSLTMSASEGRTDFGARFEPKV